MRNILLVILLAGAAFFLSRHLSSRNEENLKAKTVVRLTLWNVPPKSLPNDRRIWEETRARFEAANPGIKIEGVEREYRPEEFVTVMASGKGPDLVKVWVGAIQTLASLGFLQPVDNYIQSWNQRDSIKPVLWESTKVGNHYYGIPSDTYFLFLLYRKDLFAKAGLNPELPPANWDDLVLAAKKLTRRNQGQYGLGLVPKTWYFQDFVWQAGGEMIREVNGKPMAAFWETPAVQALKFWKDLRFKHNVLQPNVLMSETELMHLFALGKVAMIFGTAHQLPALITRYKIDAQSFGIAPMPAGPAGRAAHLGGNVFVMNASSPEEKKAAAWKWVDFELSPVNQLWKWQRMHDLKMVIFPGAFSSAAQIANIPEFALVENVLSTARVEPHVPGWPQTRALLDESPLQNVLLDQQADPRMLLLSYAKEAQDNFLSRPEKTKR
jgi:multiple sugar transport system substrate-binding protein